MDELLKQMTVQSLESAASFTYAEFALSIALAFALGLVVTLAYRATHSGVSYSRSFVLTMILMSVTVSFIMLIIGSNLARAFSLVGALSIIRYRNAVRESRDTAFIFLAMAVGMACGVRLYVEAAIFTALSTAIVLLLDRMRFGSAKREERLFRFAFPKGAGDIQAAERALGELTKGRFSLLSSEFVGGRQILTYNAELDRKQAGVGSLKELSGKSGGAEVKMLTGFEKFNI